MAAAFLKILFYWRWRAISRRRACGVVRYGVLAYGSSTVALDPRALRPTFRGVDEIGADTEFFDNFGTRLADGKRLNGLSLKT
jgi:hypothetical protein